MALPSSKNAMKYNFVESNIRDLEGKVLTVIDAVLEGQQNKATKDIIKEKFSDKMQWLTKVALKDEEELSENWRDDIVVLEE